MDNNNRSFENVNCDYDDGSLCVICPKKATQTCARCKSQLYCSQECQKTDWKVHKLLCAKFLVFQTPAPPQDQKPHCCAIVFTPGQHQPRVRFAWIPIETAHIPGEPEFLVPQLKAYEDEQTGKLTREQYHWDALRNRAFSEDALEVRYSDTFLIDSKMPLNYAVTALVAAGATEGEGVGTTSKVWRGPLVCLKYKNYLQVGKDGQFTGLPNPYPSYGNMDMRDFRRLADFLLGWHGMKNLPSCYQALKASNTDEVKPKRRVEVQETKPGVLKGVRVNCVKDQTMDHDVYEPATITREELSKAQKFNPPLLKALGLDVDVVKIPSPAEWKLDQRAHDNPAVTFFFITIDPSKSWFGLAPIEWQSFVGSVMMFKKDGTELTTKEVMDMWCYISDHVVDNMAEFGPAGSLKMITPQAFAKYLEKRSRGIY